MWLFFGAMDLQKSHEFSGASHEKSLEQPGNRSGGSQSEKPKSRMDIDKVFWELMEVNIRKRKYYRIEKRSDYLECLCQKLTQQFFV